MGVFLQCSISKSSELYFTTHGSPQSFRGGFSSARPCQGCSKALQSTALSCLSSTSTAKPKSLSASHVFLCQPKSAPDSVGLEQANELVIITPASSIQPQGPTIINDLDWNLGLTATFPKAHSSSQRPGKPSGLQ